MAGRIRAEDVAAVKERSSLEDVVREHVTLRPAGPGSLKGLCPFHDEKTPSFSVRPAVGAWHCFGCGEGGDVITFVQKVDHLSFTEAVERLAGRLGMELRYDEGSRGETGLGRRTRLVEAHRSAVELYAAQLTDSAEARPARDFLRQRGFDREAATRFGVGYSPRAGEALTVHLRRAGFSEDELVAAGLAIRGRRGCYDRFRGRLMWPIREITGDTVGFGARRLHDDDQVAAKYLNTAETSLYKKSLLLYGLDLAKKAIARDRTAVVVEGYTDVMACHLAGVETAVATCGTAFGVEHIKTLRRLMRDEADQSPARTVFTFDGDAAGQKAAMRAFAEDQRWASQSFVAVAPSGQDPCDLRLSGGDAAVRALVEDAVPMFEFAVRTTIRRFDLATAEGRVQAVRAVAPIVAGIRDRALRPEYARTVAGWVGVEVEQVADAVRQAERAAGRSAKFTAPVSPPRDPGASRGPTATPAPGPASPRPLAADSYQYELDEPPPEDGGEPEQWREPEGFPAPDLREPVVQLEAQLLQAALQYPEALSADALRALGPRALVTPAFRAVLEAVLVALDRPGRAAGASGWSAAVADAAPGSLATLVSRLAVAPIPRPVDPTSGRPAQLYFDKLLGDLREADLRRQVNDAISALRRLGTTDPDASRTLQARLSELQRELARLRAELT